MITTRGVWSSFKGRGQLDRALDVLLQMDQQGCVPSGNIYCALLKLCAKRRALAHAKRVHAHLAKHGLEATRFVGEYVVGTFVKCGGLEDAVQVFDKLPYRSVFSWTALMSGYTTAGRGQEALRMYDCMRSEGLAPDRYTFMSLLRACGSLCDLEEGRRIQAEALKFGCASDLFVGTCLVDMYGKCGSIVDAEDVFEGLSQWNVVSWTAMLAAYAQQGQAENALLAYEQMQEQGWSPDDRAFVTALQACGMLAEKEHNAVLGVYSKNMRCLGIGKVLHSEARRNSYDSDVFVGSTLVSMYGKCGSILDAQSVFGGLPDQSVVAWNAMLAVYVLHRQAESVLQQYEEMREEGMSPDNRTFVSALQACTMLADKDGSAVGGPSSKTVALTKGKAICAEAYRKGHTSDVFVGSKLVDMYGKCGSIVDAEDVFDALSEHNVVTWTAMLSAYVEHGQVEQALLVYVRMQEGGVGPTSRTYVSVLQACSMLADSEEDVIVNGTPIKLQSLQMVKAIHASAHRKGYVVDTFVGSSLVKIYGSCGSIVDAQSMFEGLSERDVVSWNAMLMAYAQQAQGHKTLQLYRQMREDGVIPDEITLGCVVQVVSSTGTLDVCRQIHLTLVSTGYKLSLLMANILIHAYGRCASMVDAQVVFDSMPQHDVVSWNALTAGYARQGNCQACLHCFEEMRLADASPDVVTFLSLLSACSHAGLVDQGIQYFESMTKDHGIIPQIGHYVTMVDLLGRAGYFTWVEHLLATMPMQPDLSLWLCLLGVCRKHSKVVLGKHAFECAARLQPTHAAPYILMASIYANSGLWDAAKEVKELGQMAGTWKEPAQSWIEHESDGHTFGVGHSKHAQREQLYDLIGKVSLELKLEGHIQQMHSISHKRPNHKFDVPAFQLPKPFKGKAIPESDHIRSEEQ